MKVDSRKNVPTWVITGIMHEKSFVSKRKVLSTINWLPVLWAVCTLGSA